MELITELSDLLGINPLILEGSAITLLLGVILYLVKIMYSSTKIDSKQVDLETMLAELLGKSFESYTQLTSTLEGICSVLKNMENAFTDVAGELKNIVIEVNKVNDNAEQTKPVLEEIKSNLIKTSTTIVTVKDVEGNVLAKLTAEPDAEGQLVVQFNSIFEKKTADE